MSKVAQEISININSILNKTSFMFCKG